MRGANRNMSLASANLCPRGSSLSSKKGREASATSIGRRKACGSAGRCNRSTPDLKARMKSPKSIGNKRDAMLQSYTLGVGSRTSPFISFWYLNLKPLISAKAMLRWWQENGNEGCRLCLLALKWLEFSCHELEF